MFESMVAAASEAISFTSNGAPARRVKLLPVGRIEMRDTRGPYMVRDQAHAYQIVANTRNWLGSADMMIDYDHQSIRNVGEGKGGRALAAGWASSSRITAEPDGIYADVEWTAAAANMLAAREYRYLSPYFTAEQGTGYVVQIKNAAIVNMGAIDLPAIAAALSIHDLVKSGDGAQILLTDAEIAICKALGWPASRFLYKKLEDMTEGEKQALQGKLDDLLSDAEIAACQLTGTSAADFVMAKLSECHQEVATNRLSAEELAVCEMTGMAPAALILAKLAETNEQAARNALSVEEIAVCDMTGMSYETFIAAKKEQSG